VVKSKDIANGPMSEFLIGFACAAAVGFLAIHLLLRYLRTRSLLPFIVYRYGVAALTIVIAAARVL
jgi:undecaprenyl-diphosphatase